MIPTDEGTFNAGKTRKEVHDQIERIGNEIRNEASHFPTLIDHPPTAGALHEMTFSPLLTASRQSLISFSLTNKCMHTPPVKCLNTLYEFNVFGDLMYMG